MQAEVDSGRERRDDAAPDPAEPLSTLELRALEMIAAGQGHDAMIAALCQAVEAHEPGARCAIVRTAEGNGAGRGGVAPGLAPRALEALDPTMFGADHAAATEDAVNAVDVTIDPRWTSWREFAAAHDIQAAWSAPIRDRVTGELLGVFACFHALPEAPAPASAARLRRAAAVAGAMMRLDREVGDLREAATRYRTLVEQLPAMIYIEQLTGDVDLYLSPQIEPMLGYTAAEVMAGNPAWPDLVHPDDRDWVDAAVRESDATGRYDETYRVVARDGSIVWIRNQAMLVHDAEGRPRYWHGVVSDLTEWKAAEERLAYLAHHDALTGVPNRTRFMERLRATARRIESEATPFAIFFVDLDGFKILNDSLGHDAGDRVLVEAAARLRTVLRPGDTLARFGGDEFVVLAEGVNLPAEAGLIADRMLAALQAPWTIDDCAAHVSGSIGVAVVEPGAPIEPADVLRAADVALYEAKTAGRARRVVASPLMFGSGGRASRDRRSGMPATAAVVRFQPEVDLTTGRIIRLDAAAFWDRLDGGLYPPAEFVQDEGDPEELVSTGYWTLREACRLARSWRLSGDDRGPGLSVHLSVHEFCQPSLPAELAGVLATGDIDPAALELRIAESTAAIVAHKIVAETRALGIAIAIDDFGKRDVSLGGVQNLAIDALLLDESVVAGIGRDRRSTTTARIVATVGREAGLAIGARGVTTVEQVDWLRRFGVERAQGDAFAPRCCARTIATLLASGAPLAPVDADAARPGSSPVK